jgi:hypothetical protein
MKRAYSNCTASYFASKRTILTFNRSYIIKMIERLNDLPVKQWLD